MPANILCTAGRAARADLLISKEVLRVGKAATCEIVIRDDPDVGSVACLIEYKPTRQSYSVRNLTLAEATLGGKPFARNATLLWEPGTELALTPETKLRLKVSGDPAPVSAELAAARLAEQAEQPADSGGLMQHAPLTLGLLAALGIGLFAVLDPMAPKPKPAETVAAVSDETVDPSLAQATHPGLKEQWVWLQHAITLERRRQVGQDGRATLLYQAIGRRARDLLAREVLTESDREIARALVDITSERAARIGG